MDARKLFEVASAWPEFYPPMIVEVTTWNEGRNAGEVVALTGDSVGQKFEAFWHPSGFRVKVNDTTCRLRAINEYTQETA